jgi:NAD(P)-dependent dehydrogenase (short-subunit alcohol dehydrogenase family)
VLLERAFDKMTSQPSVVVTGARAGLGEEFARQYRAAGWRVIAPTRTDMDVTDERSIDRYARQFDEEPIDVLINNAGIRSTTPDACTLGNFTRDGWLPSLLTNVIGPVLVTQRLLPNLRQGKQKRIVFLSSRLGSFAVGGGSNTAGTDSSYYAYRVSKTALNQITRCVAIDLAPEGFICVALSPGWVATRMGGAAASTTPTESVAKMCVLISKMERLHNGTFLDADGRTLPW